MSVLPALRFLDPKILRSITNIELRPRLLVEGMYASRHRSPNYGYSVEFKDHREYAQGDDPKTIDWKMLARTEKYFVKRFEMESNMDVVCLLDVSGSMGYRPLDGGRLTKLEFASYLVASIAYLAHKQQDSPGLVSFDRQMRDFIPPRQGQRHLHTILARLEETKAHEGTEVGDTLKQIAQRLKRRSLAILVSDCYGEPQQVVDGIRHLMAHGHDVAVFQLMDHDEVSFPFQSLTSFRDMESGTQMMCDPLRLRTTYLERLDEFRRAIQEGCAAGGADYRFVETSEPIELVLRDYLLYRRERAR
jgi:uncharacterized protein (DUF58 family)